MAKPGQADFPAFRKKMMEAIPREMLPKLMNTYEMKMLMFWMDRYTRKYSKEGEEEEVQDSSSQGTVPRSRGSDPDATPRASPRSKARASSAASNGVELADEDDTPRASPGPPAQAARSFKQDRRKSLFWTIVVSVRDFLILTSILAIVLASTMASDWPRARLSAFQVPTPEMLSSMKDFTPRTDPVITSIDAASRAATDLVLLRWKHPDKPLPSDLSVEPPQAPALKPYKARLLDSRVFTISSDLYDITTSLDQTLMNQTKTQKILEEMLFFESIYGAPSEDRVTGWLVRIGSPGFIIDRLEYLSFLMKKYLPLITEKEIHVRRWQVMEEVLEEHVTALAEIGAKLNPGPCYDNSTNAGMHNNIEAALSISHEMHASAAKDLRTSGTSVPDDWRVAMGDILCYTTVITESIKTVNAKRIAVSIALEEYLERLAEIWWTAISQKGILEFALDGDERALERSRIHLKQVWRDWQVTDKERYELGVIRG